MIQIEPAHVCETMLVDVPVDGTRVFFPAGKFSKFFNVRADTRDGVRAHIETHGLEAFSVQLFKATVPRRRADGSISNFNPKKPLSGRAIVTVNGE